MPIIPLFIDSSVASDVNIDVPSGVISLNTFTLSFVHTQGHEIVADRSLIGESPTVTLQGRVA